MGPVPDATITIGRAIIPYTQPPTYREALLGANPSATKPAEPQRTTPRYSTDDPARGVLTDLLKGAEERARKSAEDLATAKRTLAR
jgi:hypothetical protein